ncbi:excalibur calcium-binding domain-containing protein [Rheinheimera baltica]|uniref:excalibur calcium-binding domain-containing protein n=1 Tax=Rheinheimera baltica TaxID=67576 RepID=UPI00273E66BB|nr:excalibur calcium-binding domain-containing protein [Rheinheimera baltica]MDP5143776.1 excalibur calcium-binding domain-containing protein [Rheinheimera baltica]MDP5151844.1 excalibur calcium-binding domain-containing protein [Rheinheimera baltica]MDP5188750.1 excalibur calcium-binding domain-containing protein [Rheinheimera baltica]
MKKLLLIALVAFGAWNYYQKQNTAKPILESVPQVLPDYTVPINKARAVANASQFRCDGRQHCSEMNSYEEAVFFLRNCPDTKMDGDGDGVPCERQFNRF